MPRFAQWKGEIANEVLRTMWEVSGGDKAFILTMAAENGKFDPYLRHSYRNKDGSWDYSFGLNSYYHQDMIKRITEKTATIKEIVEYHWNIYNGREWTTSCGRKPFCGYNNRDKAKSLILFN